MENYNQGAKPSSTFDIFHRKSSVVTHLTRRKSYRKISCASALLKVIIIRDAQPNTTEQKQKGEGKKLFCWPSEKYQAFGISTPSNCNCDIAT